MLCCAFADCTEGRRAENFSSSEKALLIELVEKFPLVESKETDRVTSAEKAAAWKLLADEFCAVNTVKRTADQLKQVVIYQYMFVTMYNQL